MNAAQIQERAAQLILEERTAYCIEVLGWERGKAEALTQAPASWVQLAVERALKESAE